MAAPEIASVSNVIKGVAGLIAIVPGLALITSAVVLPLTLQQVLGGLALTLGVVIVLAVYLFGQRLHRMKAQKVGVVVLGLAVAGAAAVIFFAGLARTQIFDRPVNGVTEVRVLPLHPTGRLKADLALFNNDYEEALHHRALGAGVEAEIERQNGSAMLLLSATFLLAQALLLSAIVIGAWKLADAAQKRGAAPAET